MRHPRRGEAGLTTVERLLIVLVAIVSGLIGQITAIAARHLGARPLQLAACACGLLNVAVLLSTPIFGNQHYPGTQGWPRRCSDLRRRLGNRPRHHPLRHRSHTAATDSSAAR